MGESWIVSNLNAALSTWNDKLAEIWSLLTESPQTFKGGQVWGVMTGIHGALQAIGYGLLVLFFAVGVMKTCGSFVEVKKPEHALKLFIRFALAKGAVTYGLELMLAVFSIVQGIHLTTTEYQLFITLLDHSGYICSRNFLLASAWNITVPIQTRTVDVHIAKLRKKLDLGPDDLKTVTRQGYALST